MRFLLMTMALGAPVFAQYSMFPAVRGTREMVGAANNFEVEAGFRILQQGGNAVDAGVAAILTATVTEQARIGLGGEMPVIIKMKDKPARVLSAIGIAPAKATPDYYRKRPAEPWEKGERELAPVPFTGVRAAITPGIPSGLLTLLADHGTMTFAQVAQPAIEYAEGFPIGEEFASFIRNGANILNFLPASRDFFMPGGRIPERGELYRMPDLANTLKKMAAVEKKARGNRVKKLNALHDYFYKGDIAKTIADFMAKNDGLMTRDDLAKFHAKWDEPRRTTFHGYEVLKPGFFTQGPVMIEALNILEGYDLKAMGHNSPQYLHTVLEAVKLAFADRDRYYGDPDFSTIPERELLSKEYGERRRKQIDAEKANNEHRPGALAGVSQPAMPSQAALQHDVAQDTTCVNVVDKWGNMFSATPSGAWLPSTIVAGTGIPLSMRAESFVITDGHANQIGPGKRPRVTLSPTMVLKDGKPYIAMSTPGGDNQDQAMLQVLLNMLVFDMTAQQAAEAPRFQTEHFYASFRFHEFVAGKVNLEGRFPKATIDALRAKGHGVEVKGDWSNGSAPTVIKVGADGVLDGGADPRRGRFIFGR